MLEFTTAPKRPRRPRPSKARQAPSNGRRLDWRPEATAADVAEARANDDRAQAGRMMYPLHIGAGS